MKKLTEKLKSLWAKINQLRKKDNDQLKELSDPENNAEQAGPDQAQTLVKKITHSLSDKIKSILPLKKNKTSPAHDKKPIVNLNPLKWQKALENIFKK